MTMTAKKILDEVAAEHDKRRQRRIRLRLELSADGIGLSREFSEATDADPYGTTLDQLNRFAKRLRRAGIKVRIFRVTTTMEEEEHE